MSNCNSQNPTSEMDLTQQRDCLRQHLAEIKRLLADKKNHNISIQEDSNDVLKANMQTRRRCGLDEVDICTMALSQKDKMKRYFNALASSKKELQTLKDSDDAEIRKIFGYDREIDEMLSKFEIVSITAETAKLDKKIVDVEKKVTERRNQLAKLVNEKMSAQARLDRTKQKCVDQMVSLVNKRSEVKLRLMNLKMVQALRVKKY